MPRRDPYKNVSLHTLLLRYGWKRTQFEPWERGPGGRAMYQHPKHPGHFELQTGGTMAIVTYHTTEATEWGSASPKMLDFHLKIMDRSLNANKA